MRQTLFTIDHFFFENHWALLLWLLVGLAYIGYQFYKGTRSEALQFIPVYAIGAALIFFVIPKLETLGVDSANPSGPLVPDGLAIRGYGLFLLLAMVIGFGLAMYRSHQIGFDSEKTLSLGFWMVVVGLIGARVFYVIQKFERFSDVGPQEFWFRLIDMTSGGLVVYGSLIGGILAAIVYLAINKINWRTISDIMAPGMVIGLAIGRIGCLMNGCCYGGVCEDAYPGLYFPAGSPPYMQQFSNGSLLGIDGDLDPESYTVTVRGVAEDSLAERLGIKQGEQVQIHLTRGQEAALSNEPDDLYLRLRAAKSGTPMELNAVVYRAGATPVSFPVSELPAYSKRTHPTQLYSSVNAFCLSLFLWFYFPYRKNAGEVFALMLLIYPLGRFVLEIIRRDEGGLFGTTLTISQWVSLGIFACGVLVFLYVRAVPDGQSTVAVEPA